MKTPRSLLPRLARLSSRRRRLLICAAALALLPIAGQVHDLVVSGRDVPNLDDLLAVAAPPHAAPGGVTLCVDGPEFMAAVARDITAAEDRVLVQTLSFEADAAGYALASALTASSAREKTILVDAFSRYVVSDKFLYDPTRLLDLPLGEEARATLRLLEHLRAHGVAVKFGRPYGPGEDNLAARDHKKIVIADDAVYVGGINFSEHNFLWHDLMLRIEDAAVADALAADVQRSLGGVSGLTRGTFGNVEIVTGRGGGTHDVLAAVAGCIAGARDSIYLECPYVTEPYFELLGAARRRGVEVIIVTSEKNNRLCMKQSIMDACRRHDLDLRLLPGRMTHVKAMLVDGETLLMGSANFDFLSATLQPEVVAVVRDPGAVAQFEERVMAPGLAESWAWPTDRTDPVIGSVSSGVMSLAKEILRLLHRRE